LLVDEFVLGMAAVIDDVAFGAEDAVGEPIVAHEDCRAWIATGLPEVGWCEGVFLVTVQGGCRAVQS
jgi:hypothetical protein